MQLFSSATGSDLLIVYGVLLAASTAAAWAIPARLRAAGRRGEVLDAESAGFLAGGRARLAETVMADLYVRGGLEARGGSRLAVSRREMSAGPAGKALLALEGTITTNTAKAALKVHAERLAGRLRRAGLLMWPDDHLRLRWLSIAPFLALLVFGLYRLRAADTVDAPTGPLPVLLGLTLLLAAIRFARSDPRTKAGIAALDELRQRRGQGIGSARGEYTAMAVALHGTAVLVGTPWEALHALRQPGEGGSGSSQADGGSGDWFGDASCDAGGDGGGCGD
ncbi:MAG: TIGR04222 domain-containing membrane protein [Erythrobacter sp.]